MADCSLAPMTPVIRLDPSPRARSRSPERKALFSPHTLDPLLSNLSPESTLQALSAVDALRAAPGSAHDILAKSIANVSATDRAFGIRAALAAQKLKEWYKEVRGWQWCARRDAGLGKGFLAPSDVSNNISKDKYLGSLPVELVMRYESRIEEIRDEMDRLDLHELKEHVLDQHIPVRSRPTSSCSTISSLDPPLSYFQLSDFSAVITATILHALPILSKLNILLERWCIRFRVLRLIPGLRSGLSQTKAAIDTAMDRINKGVLPNSDDIYISKEAFAAARATLEVKVLRVGAQMDTILDFLEGHEDSLPDSWIDDMENIESGFATWAALAEQKAMESEWLSKLGSPATQPATSTTPCQCDGKDESTESTSQTQKELDVESNAVSEQNVGDQSNLSPETAPEKALESQVGSDVSTTHALLAPPALDGSTILSESDLTQSILTTSSSVSSLGSQAHHCEMRKDPASNNNNSDTNEVTGPQASELPHISVQDAEEHDVPAPLSSAGPKSKENTRRPETPTEAVPGDSIQGRNEDAESSSSSHFRTTSDSLNDDAEFTGPRLRRTLSSASVPSEKPADRHERSLRDRFAESRASRDISRMTTVSPLVFPDSPPPPTEPLKPSKRYSRSNASSTAGTNKKSQLKRLEPALEMTPSKSTSKAPPSPSKAHQDQLDQKISCILTKIPGRIRLASEGLSDSDEPPNLRRPSRTDRATSISPSSTRSRTPTPSLTLTRTRRTRTHKDDSSVKVYHLHRGGKTVPTKLFVRSVGEDGERVMVRVGGGWADLGEYLREYVIHHGRRNVLDEKFEIKGIPSRNTSNNYTSPGRLTPSPGSGRNTPVARPGSAFDIRRPSSALSVRRSRRLTGTEDDLPSFRNPNFQTPGPAFDDPDSPPEQRRLSVSSSFSTDGPTTPNRSRPLGLAGPKPRSRNVSMSPESEAWVEGVMGEARKKTAPLRHQFSSGTLRNLPTVAENENRSGQKLRSVSDIGGGSRRVYLRGLSK